jgi:predicted nuclease with TOPRIM domain
MADAKAPPKPNNNNKSNKPDKGKTNIILLILLVLLLGVTGFLFMKNHQLNTQLIACNTETQEVDSERQEVIAELNSMLEQYDALSVENQNLSADLLAEKEKVKKLLKQARNKDFVNSKLKKEVGTLRDIMKGYLVTIDSLNTLNLDLTAENIEFKEKLSETEEKYSSLEQEKENLASKVEIGSQLRVTDMIALAQRVKTNGIHRETTKAQKTDMIKCCFTIADNALAEAGKRDVYLRIISPYGAILTNIDDKFEFRGVRGRYSAKKSVDYEKQKLDVCMYWEVPDDVNLTSGSYYIKAYCDKTEIGAVNLVLK